MVVSLAGEGGSVVRRGRRRRRRGGGCRCRRLQLAQTTAPQLGGAGLPSLGPLTVHRLPPVQQRGRGGGGAGLSRLRRGSCSAHHFSWKMMDESNKGEYQDQNFGTTLTVSQIRVYIFCSMHLEGDDVKTVKENNIGSQNSILEC